MTEKSYYYDGAVTGDAGLAPYSSFVYNYLTALTESSTQAFVYEDTAGEKLEVTGSAVALSVSVTAGNAFIYGVWYRNSAAVTLTIPPNNSSYRRIDRVVIRVDWEAQTARLALKMGTPTLVPVPPDLVQDPGVMYEMTLACVQVPEGATDTEFMVLDERKFMEIYKNFTDSYDYINENLFFNSEFMAGSGNGSTAAEMVMAGWLTHGESTLWMEKFPQMDRGSTVWANPDAYGDNLAIDVLSLATNTTIPYTLKMLIEVLTGEVWVGVDGAVGGDGIVLYPTYGPIELIFRRDFDAITPDLNLIIANYAGDASFRLGQVTLAQGNVGAPFVPKREIIPINVPFGATVSGLSGVGSYPIPSRLAPGMKALFTKLKVTDSGSAGAATTHGSIRDYLTSAFMLRVEIGNVVNDKARTNHGFIGIGYYNRDPYLQVFTQPATTMQVRYDFTAVVT